MVLGEAKREGEKRVDLVLTWLVRRREHHNVDRWLLIGPIIFLVLTIGIFVEAPAFYFGPKVRNVETDSYTTINFTEILYQIPLIVATGLVAVATYLVFRATKEMAHNIIRPFLIVRPSTPHEREEYFLCRNFPDGSQPERWEFINKKGIILENVGLGPAVKGKVTVRVDGRSMSETFGRLYRSEADGEFRYFYPSPSSRNIEIPEDVHEISVGMQYYDIAEKYYSQRAQRIAV